MDKPRDVYPSRIKLSEASQEEKDKYCMILLICEIHKMVQRNLFIKEI